MIPDPANVFRGRFPTRAAAIAFLREFEPAPGDFVATDQDGVDHVRGGGNVFDGFAIQPLDLRRPLTRVVVNGNGDVVTPATFDNFPGPPQRRAVELIFIPWGDEKEAIAAAMRATSAAFTPGINDQRIETAAT